MSDPDLLSATIYTELRKIAASHLRREQQNHTLQPTALVHEAYLRLAGQDASRWNDRTHFLALASQMMRRVLVDHARTRLRDKRGGGAAKLSLDEAGQVAASRDAEVLDVDQALNRLAELDPRKSRLVELRYFGGLTMDEAATVMNCSVTTAERDWRFARAFLHHELTGK